MFRKTFVLLLFCLAICNVDLFAEDKDMLEKKRDPFANSELIVQESVRRRGQPEFIPSQGGVVIPMLRLRGFIKMTGEQPAALVEAENFGVYVVRTSDTISLQQGTASTVLKVKNITDSSVIVEVGTLGQVIIVR